MLLLLMMMMMMLLLLLLLLLLTHAIRKSILDQLGHTAPNFAPHLDVTISQQASN